MTKTTNKNEPTPSDLDSVSKRLKYIVDTLGVKQSHMASKLGVSPAGLHYILNNDVKFSKNAKKIADYLNINEHWLETGEGEIYEENTSITTYKIPIFYPDQLKLHYKSQQSDSISSSNYYITTTAYQNKVIAIYNTDTTFSPKFELGDIIAFEHSESFDDGEIILIYIHSNNELLIKTAFHLTNEMIALLTPTDSSPSMINSIDCTVIGCYRECLKKHN